ncbi:MAG: helix-turn-helix domain-containing protein [Clostridia bacterium]|nr:helix-turn-helix domain-containing protein [Clostridia bacterium]
MRFCDINPFMRYAELQPSVMSSAPLSCSYDYRIFYIIEGSANFVLADRTLPISAGTLIYFRPGTPYYFDGKVKVIVLNFDLTQRQADQKKPLRPSKSVSTFQSELIFENDPPQELSDTVVIKNAFEVEAKMQECLLRYRYRTLFSDAFASAAIKEILCYVAQNAAQAEAPPLEIVQKIALFIEQHYDKDIDNLRISHEFGYHSYYLNRIFKRSTGITIHQAVMQERMRMAKRLLKETALGVHAVAAEVGFPDRSQFCTAFKKQVGCTPTEYRKQKARA